MKILTYSRFNTLINPLKLSVSSNQYINWLTHNISIDWLFIIGLVLMPTNKAILAWFIGFAILKTLLSKHPYLGWFTAYMYAIPLSVGKWYSVNVIPWQSSITPDISFDYQLGWAILPSLVLIIFSVVLFFIYERVDFKKYLLNISFPIKYGLTLFAGYLFFNLLSCFNSIFPTNSLSHFLYQLSFLPTLLISHYLLTQKPNTRPQILNVIKNIFIFEFILGTLQFIKQSTLGLAIEPLTSIDPSGGWDQLKIIRPIGTLTNPNQFSLYMSLLALSILEFKTANQIFIGIVGIWSVIISLSRSLWLGGFIVAIRFYHKIRTLINWRQIKTYPFLTLAISLVILGCGYLIALRTIKAAGILEKYGGLSDRIIFLTESIQIIANNPLLGSGPNTNESSLFKYFPTGIITYFPSVVHNAYLQIGIDAGILAVIMILVSCYFFYQASFNQLFHIALFLTASYFLFQPILYYQDFGLLGLIIGTSLSKPDL